MPRELELQHGRQDRGDEEERRHQETQHPDGGRPWPIAHAWTSILRSRGTLLTSELQDKRIGCTPYDSMDSSASTAGRPFGPASISHSRVSPATRRLNR